MIEPRFAFGLTAKESENIADILEAIEELSEGTADIIAWTRGTTHRIIVSGPIILRAQLTGEFETVVIRPLGQIQETMDRNDNEWVIPANYDEAKELLLEFKMAMWQDIEVLAKEKVEDKAVEKPLKAPQNDSRSKDVELERKTEQAPQNAPESVKSVPEISTENLGDAGKAVLAAFGLMGGMKDEDGNEIKLSVLKRSDKK